MKPIYTAANTDTAESELEAFEAGNVDKKCPTAGKAFRDTWERFAPFLALPCELRHIIYTTNSTESLNYQLRQAIKNRRCFPNDTAAIKLMWLVICNIEDKRAREREKGRRNRRKGEPRTHRAGRLIQDTTTPNRKRALAQLALAYPERIPPTSNNDSNPNTNYLTSSTPAAA